MLGHQYGWWRKERGEDTPSTLRPRPGRHSPHSRLHPRGLSHVVREAGKWSPACCCVPHRNAGSGGRGLRVCTMASPGLGQHNVTQTGEKPPPMLLRDAWSGCQTQRALRHWSLEGRSSGKPQSRTPRRSHLSMVRGQQTAGMSLEQKKPPRDPRRLPSLPTGNCNPGGDSGPESEGGGSSRQNVGKSQYYGLTSWWGVVANEAPLWNPGTFTEQG